MQVDGDKKRSLRERGASLVEFALVAPLFFAIVFGGIEIGLMFRTYLAIENLSRSAARIASIERAEPDADQQILDQVARLTAPLQGDVQRVVIFTAPTLDAEVPAACAGPSASSQSGICQVYTITDGDVASRAAGPEEPGWRSINRMAGENIGIHIELDYEFATGFFSTLSLATTTVEVIEQDV